MIYINQGAVLAEPKLGRVWFAPDDQHDVSADKISTFEPLTLPWNSIVAVSVSLDFDRSCCYGISE